MKSGDGFVDFCHKQSWGGKVWWKVLKKRLVWLKEELRVKVEKREEWKEAVWDWKTSKCIRLPLSSGTPPSQLSKPSPA
jgi:hypothetical protein